MAKSKTRPASEPVSPEEHGGNFGVGLFVGVVAGSLGMFLFGTQQGQELMKNLKKELEDGAESKDLPERAKNLIASVRTSVEGQLNDQFDTAEKTDEFPKFKRRLAE